MCSVYRISTHSAIKPLWNTWLLLITTSWTITCSIYAIYSLLFLFIIRGNSWILGIYLHFLQLLTIQYTIYGSLYSADCMQHTILCTVYSPLHTILFVVKESPYLFIHENSHCLHRSHVLKQFLLFILKLCDDWNVELSRISQMTTIFWVLFISTLSDLWPHIPLHLLCRAVFIINIFVWTSELMGFPAYEINV